MNPHLRSPWKLIRRGLRFAGVLVLGRIRIGDRTYRARGLTVDRVALTATARDRDWLHELYRAVLPLRPGAFIDVGANTGQTMFKVLALDPGRQYVGFEPQASCAHLLGAFIAKNQLEGHVVMPAGLSDVAGMKRIYLSTGSGDPTASLVGGFRPPSFYTEEQWVPVLRGDDAISGLDLEAIAVVKIDVEGGELEVVRGLVSTLEQFSPLIVFEVLHHYLAATGSSIDEETIEFRETRLAEMEAMLRSGGYTIYRIVGSSRVQRIDRIAPTVSEDLRLTDYVAVPEDERALFEAALSPR